MLKTIINRKITILILIISVFIFLVVSPLSYKQEIGYLETPVNEVVYGVQSVFYSIVESVENVWLKYIYLVDLYDANEMLKENVFHLTLDIGAMKSEIEAVDRLKELLAYKQGSKFELLTSEIIGFSPTSWLQTLVINNGSKNGVKEGMGVISSRGNVVGKVMKVTPHFSRVLVLADRSFVVPVIINRTRVQGIVEGIDRKTVRMKYLPIKSEIEIGDTVVTSGLMGSFPKGLLVGTVKDIHKVDVNQFIDLEIDSAVDFLKQEIVFVVLPDEDMQKELDSLKPPSISKQ